MEIRGMFYGMLVMIENDIAWHLVGYDGIRWRPSMDTMGMYGID